MSYAEVKMVKILRRHFMQRKAIVLVIHAVHSMAATAGCHCRTREYKRKCGGSNYSELRHDRSPLGPKHGRAPLLGNDGGRAATVHAAPSEETRHAKTVRLCKHQAAKQIGSPP
ncbi:hypothetical protein [Bradyrhizobium sp.]|uniref:hypothetical protein n=1 Tax=Bradyrhizobium sp. TaxID=376 RepID=UPI003C794D3E